VSTVGKRFRQQLYQLMSELETTQSHYVRCIKPNNHQLADVFQSTLVLTQLKNAGAGDALHICRMGFPFRIEHLQFFRRYRATVPQCRHSLATAGRFDLASADGCRQACQTLLLHLRRRVQQRLSKKLDKLRLRTRGNSSGNSNCESSPDRDRDRDGDALASSPSSSSSSSSSEATTLTAVQAEFDEYDQPWSSIGYESDLSQVQMGVSALTHTHTHSLPRPFLFSLFFSFFV
jgi:hypothetical protein